MTSKRVFIGEEEEREGEARGGGGGGSDGEWNYSLGIETGQNKDG
jgi:hypothetical protein